MSNQDFLVEIGTEELPPKALLRLANAFCSTIVEGLKQESLAHGDVKTYATPRRLAVFIAGLETKQADRRIEKFGPAVKAAYDGDGNPTRAATGFAKSCGVEVGDLSTAEKDGVEKLSFSSTQPGKQTKELLPAIVDTALAKLPIPKRMRWGASRNEFVRPVHWVVLMLGEEVVDSTVLGIESGNETRGHRFHYPQNIQISKPDDYESLLENPGNVIADFSKRKELIRAAILAEGESLDALTVVDEDLLEEVTSLVEYPVALTGKFDELFLAVPPEALILAMKSHQKCFYLVDKDQNLLPHFVTVSNIRSKDPVQVIEGNERVIRPRLADAKFFFEVDQQATLESRLDQLKKVVFQEKLGTVFDRSHRISRLASYVATNSGGDAEQAKRAGLLSKCDLVTNMVGEFADLQGLMGSYYARNDGEDDAVATAINEQYQPRFAGDSLPKTAAGSALAIADKLDSICGLFAIGQPPTGSKDPFALRRSAIGVLRIMVENELDLDLMECIEFSLDGFDSVQFEADTAEKIFEFMLERFRSWYADEGVASSVFQSVMQLKPRRPLDFSRRVRAVSNFEKLDESEALAAANKRVSNLLDKADLESLSLNVDESLFEVEAETRLFHLLNDKELNTAPLFESGDYTSGLAELAALREPVDTFFDDVLVMCDDNAVQNNRLALLERLRAIFLRAADISYLHSS